MAVEVGACVVISSVRQRSESYQVLILILSDTISSSTSSFVRLKSSSFVILGFIVNSVISQTITSPCFNKPATQCYTFVVHFIPTDTLFFSFPLNKTFLHFAKPKLVQKWRQWLISIVQQLLIWRQLSGKK